MEIKDTLVIAKEFTDTPGARDYDDGDLSGLEFYEKVLRDRFNAAVKGGYILKIDLDGVWGYPSSFVSGSFGTLSKAHGAESVLSHLSFKSDKNPLRIEKIIFEIKNPDQK
jgi:hypothetical protein